MSRLNYSLADLPLPGWAAIALALAAGNGLAGGTHPSEVATMQFGHGTRLTDARGFTLYQYENDLAKPGSSTCNDDCAVKRPPLVATDLSQEIPENWSLVERDDGAQQWAYDGMPLHRYQRDKHEGVAYGEGDGWTIAFEPLTTPSDITIASTVLGHVLASAGGRTLYFRDQPPSAPFECKSECSQTWLPHAAPWGAIDYGQFSVNASDDGVFQWAYRNKPLYLYQRDSTRGDVNGEGIDGVWKTMLLEPAPQIPEWITVVGSDGGTLYADADGMTLYMLLEDGNATEQAYIGGNHCDAACLSKYWNPVRAPSVVPPVGNWSVLERKDQTLQWAYIGRPVYASKLETRPGQLYYTTFRQFQWMKPIMYSLPALQGVF